MWLLLVGHIIVVSKPANKSCETGSTQHKIVMHGESNAIDLSDPLGLPYPLFPLWKFLFFSWSDPLKISKFQNSK